ncbi:AAA domain-containing protein [Bacillus sp. DNRA2]|uniref:AAA family ATPase n=1 Tax=Bacillus sp. DNRA2 TaxID=2723053 RepID=UPI00145F813A|nr:AAA family ATPase [Bacillus sp. DNRA2]NMD71701.1 AAA domain-containing protein [Bacillus sp. DNRA2]
MEEEQQYYLSPQRKFTSEEKLLIWKKPASHINSEEEERICCEVQRNWHRGEMKIANILLEGDAGSGKTQLAKALSSDFGLPYTKVTCFSDMDKTDIIGAILPVISDEHLLRMEAEDQKVLKVLYESDGFQSAQAILMDLLKLTAEQATDYLKQLIKKISSNAKEEVVEYRFYPSEIIRAYENGYLLEIQEPTVIRDAAVLMALNSALELDGSINLPTKVIHRHPDFIVVLTTNRDYTGSRPLNEALRDRIQHVEKMDLPSKEVMMERAMAKTQFQQKEVLSVLAECIILLDQTARANAIKGVAGMRSYLYWVDAVAAGIPLKSAMYHKVIYKMTTDEEEIRLLEEALRGHEMFTRLEEVRLLVKKH